MLTSLVTLLFTASAYAIDTHPIPVGPLSTPFFAALADLAAHNYVEDEYLVSGNANVYTYDEDLELDVLAADVPYTTRMLVRRPADPRDFNGVVVFEMLNPTAKFDIDFVWQYTHPLLMRRGYVWVGVTIRDDAIASLQAFDPSRYAALSLPDRGLSYDAYGDLAVLFRDASDPHNPLAAYDVTHVLGAGYSQSEDWLTTFSNELHEHKIAWDGATAFDGYLGVGGNAAARTIRSDDPTALFGDFYDDDRRMNRVAVPYFRIQSETELDIFYFPASNVRQPDSEVFRQWEVAGTSHADAPSTRSISATIERDWGSPLPPCDAPTGEVAMAPTIRAGLASLTRWVKYDVAPPASQWIEIDGPGEVRRDGHGNALGGIRIPEVDVPIGSYFPSNSGGGPCIFAPTFTAFSPETLNEMYPTHGCYVRGVARSANRLRRAGYLLRADAIAYKRAAAQSNIGR